MDVFDDTIRHIKQWFLQKIKEKETNVRKFYAPVSSATSQGTSGTLNRAESKNTIILKEDTCLELGHPSMGSCYANLATRDSALVENGCITLAGPDFPEIKAEMIPFAQIALVCCKSNVRDVSVKMDRDLHTSVQHDGYMIRSMPNKIWARVSKHAALSGFSLPELGHSVLNALKRDFREIILAEIFFVTSSREDVSDLNEIIEPARKSLRKLMTFDLTDDDTYECTASLDCDVCPERPVCDSIRDVIKIRKGDRIISFGEEAAGE